MRRAQQITWPTYKKQSLSINAKLRHYFSVVKPEATYASETLFKLNTRSTTDKLQKVDRRILRTILNKKHQVEGQWRLLPNSILYKENESIIDTMRKRRIAFFGHISRLPNTRLLKQLFDFFWNSKTKITWCEEIQMDLDELKITKHQIEHREEKRLLNNKYTRLTFKISQRKQYVISAEERAARSSRMKKYWERKKLSRIKN